MIMRGNKNAEQSHNIKPDNSLFGRMEEFRCFGNKFVIWGHFGLCTADNYRYF